MPCFCVALSPFLEPPPPWPAFHFAIRVSPANRTQEHTHTHTHTLSQLNCQFTTSKAFELVNTSICCVSTCACAFVRRFFGRMCRCISLDQSQLKLQLCQLDSNQGSRVVDDLVLRRFCRVRTFAHILLTNVLEVLRVPSLVLYCSLQRRIACEFWSSK